MGKRTRRDADRTRYPGNAQSRIRKLAQDARAEGGEEAAAHALLAEHSRVAHEILDPLVETYVREAEANARALVQALELVEQIVEKLHDLRRQTIDLLADELPGAGWSAPPPYDFDSLLGEARRVREAGIPALSERQE